MFTTEEQTLIETALGQEIIDDLIWDSAKENKKPIRFIDLKDFTKTYSDLRLRANGEIYTDLSINELADIFNLNSEEIEEKNGLCPKKNNAHLRLSCAEHPILRNHRIYLSESVPNENYYDRYTNETTREMLKTFFRERVGLETLLKTNELHAQIIQHGANLLLDYNGVLKPLYDKVLAEDRSLIISTATPVDDYLAKQELIYIVNGINRTR